MFASLPSGRRRLSLLRSGVLSAVPMVRGSGPYGESVLPGGGRASDMSGQELGFLRGCRVARIRASSPETG